MRSSLILKSVTATWLAVIVAGVANFVLTPFILHRLGDEAYGIWVLSVTLADYYCFLQIGMRSAVVRYVSRALALDEVEGVRQIVATSFLFYAALAACVLVLVFLTAGHVTHFFPISAVYTQAFMWLFIMLGIAQACDFPLSLSEGCLEAIGRFDQLYGIRIAGILLRVVAIVIVLRGGGGLLAVGAATVLSILLPRFLSYVFAYKQVKGFRVQLRGFDWKIFKEMASYGTISFTVGMGIHLRNSLYPVIIAKFLSSSAVTLFSIPAKLLSVPLNGIGSMTEFVNPMSSRMEAHEDKAGLQRLLLMSTEGACLLYAPLAVIMIVLGKQLITLWVGVAYSGTYSLLVLLTFGMGISSTQASMQSMLFGIGRHKPLVILRFAEALGTVALGTLLLRQWGLWGYALASMLVPVFMNVFIVARYACRQVGLPYGTYLTNGFLRAFLYSIPFTCTLLLSHYLFPETQWKFLILACVSAGIVYLLTVACSNFLAEKFQIQWLKLRSMALLQKEHLSAPEAVEIGGGGAIE